MKTKSAPLVIDERGNGFHTAHPVTLAFDYDRSEVTVKFEPDEQQKYVRAAKGFCTKRLKKYIQRLENWPHPVAVN